MAISDLTKTVVMQLKNQISNEIKYNEREIASFQVNISNLQARNVALQAQLNALKADIAAPTAAPIGE